MNTADLSQIFLLQHTRTQGRDGPEEQRTLASRYGCAEGCPPLPAETAPALTEQERSLESPKRARSQFSFPGDFPYGPLTACRAPVSLRAGVWQSCYDDSALVCTATAPSPHRSPSAAENTMPVVKYPRAVEPLWHEWDGKAQKCGLRHTVYAVNGDQYTGEWLDNLKHGKGTQIWKRTGAIYSGDWKFGKRDGYGSYSIPHPVTKEYKKVYTGWWKNDKKCGYGTMFYPSRECYEGEWSGGLRSGWGRMCYGDGSVYEGQWLAGQPGGQGILCLSNENRYEGGWKDGKKHGPGRFFYLDKGQLLEGIWVADIPKCGIMIDFGRDEAPAPTQYPIPKVELADPDAVLAEAQVMFDDNQN